MLAFGTTKSRLVRNLFITLLTDAFIVGGSSLLFLLYRYHVVLGIQFHPYGPHFRVNKQNDTALFETLTDGYDLLNLYTSYRLSQAGNNVTLFASASNLLDEEIRRQTSFVKELAPLPGRPGIFGVRLSF